MRVGLFMSLGLALLGFVAAVGLVVASLRPEPGADMVLMALPMCVGLSAIGSAFGILLWEQSSPRPSGRVFRILPWVLVVLSLLLLIAA